MKTKETFVLMKTIVLVIILCRVDSSNFNVDQHRNKSPVIAHLLTEDCYYPSWGCPIIFLQSGKKKLLSWQWIEPPTLDFSSHLGAFDLSAKVKPFYTKLSKFLYYE